LRLEGTEEQQRFFYGRVPAGERLGDALSETGTKTAYDHATRIARDGTVYRLNGRKFYSTGVPFAHGSRSSRMTRIMSAQATGLRRRAVSPCSVLGKNEPGNDGG
jgi:alkylation response protein AidB-like acyl-CoA dehydrogenase